MKYSCRACLGCKAMLDTFVLRAKQADDAHSHGEAANTPALQVVQNSAAVRFGCWTESRTGINKHDSVEISPRALKPLSPLHFQSAGLGVGQFRNQGNEEILTDLDPMLNHFSFEKTHESKNPRWHS